MAVRGGANHHFFVVPPKVFKAAAAARDDDQVRARNRAERIERVEPPDAVGDFGGRRLALYPYRPDKHMKRKAIRNPVQDVADHRAGRRRYHTDHAGQGGQQLLALFGEQALPLIPIVKRDFPRINILEVENGQAAVQAVADGQAEGAVEVKLFANSLINSEFAGQIRSLSEQSVLPAGFAFAAVESGAALIPIIDRALVSMPSDDRERAIRRWVAVDLEPERRLRDTLRILVPTLLGLLLLAGLIGFWNRRLAKENRRRRQAEQRLVDMTDRLRTGVFQFRRFDSGRIKTVFTNRIAQEVSRAHAADDPKDHRGFFDWVHADDKSRVMASLERSLSSGEPFRESFRFTYPDGGLGWIIAEATARPESDGSTVWSGYLFDLTSERKLTEQLDASLEAKNEFLAIAGHELRTPIHNTVLSLANLNEAELSPANKQAYENANRSLQNMSEMVSDLMDLSRADSRELTLNLRPTRLSRLVDIIANSFELPMQEKGLAFSCVVRAEVPIFVEIDQTRLRQVLYNLLGNALKYTDHGAVRLTVSTSLATQGSGYGDQTRPSNVPVLFEVEDTGIGIAPQHIDQIFEAFSTVGPADRKSTGLGLAVVKRIVTAMGGQITAQSTVGQGSVFSVVLPLKVSDTGHGSEPSESAGNLLASMSPQTMSNTSSAATGPRKLLLVDDDRLARIMLMMLLRDEGFEVIDVGSADEALARIRNERFDVVITDYHMPGANGLDLGTTIRGEISTGQNAPILIVLTGGMPHEIEALMGQVFDDVLIKPVSVGQIKALLNKRDRTDSSVGEQRVHH